MNNLLALKFILPLITLIVGAFLGYWANKIQQQYKITLKILEKFLIAKEELCEKISDLASIRIGDSINDGEMLKKRNEINKLYYKYFDYYPKEVLIELGCLYACLSIKNYNLYSCKNKKILPVKDEKEICVMVDRVSLFSNIKYHNSQALLSKNETVRKSASILYQSRNVLLCINEYLTTKKMMGLVKHLRKSEGSNRLKAVASKLRRLKSA
jgi:hypothetical protein